MLPDYYAILRILSDASEEEIRAAYRRLAKESHPDAGGSSEAFHTVQEAYEVLSDPVCRRQYDAGRNRRVSRAVVVEPLIPPEPLRASRFRPRSPLEEFDRLFQEFDEFFERLEEQFHGPSWGRNE